MFLLVKFGVIGALMCQGTVRTPCHGEWHGHADSVEQQEDGSFSDPVGDFGKSLEIFKKYANIYCLVVTGT